MLINLSNHSFNFWDNKQKNQAEQFYSKVIDVPFPNVKPDASAEDIKTLGNEIAQKLIEQYGNTSTVFHIMGEMTLTFHLVNLLKTAGYTCVASTSERIVTYAKDGTKNVTFNFVQFRAY